MTKYIFMELSDLLVILTLTFLTVSKVLIYPAIRRLRLIHPLFY